MANNEDIVKTLAKMVDERLTVEFEKRDKAILDLKKGMDTLVQSLRENGNNNMKRLKSGSQSARGSPRPALAGRRLSPRPPGVQTALTYGWQNVTAALQTRGFGRSPVVRFHGAQGQKIKSQENRTSGTDFWFAGTPRQRTIQVLPDMFGYIGLDQKNGCSNLAAMTSPINFAFSTTVYLLAIQAMVNQMLELWLFLVALTTEL